MLGDALSEEAVVEAKAAAAAAAGSCSCCAGPFRSKPLALHAGGHSDWTRRGTWAGAGCGAGTATAGVAGAETAPSVAEAAVPGWGTGAGGC